MRKIPPRLLLGPGPANVHPRVLAAMQQPLLGHLDPAFGEILDEVQRQLRALFGTQNERTLPLSATGSAGMEACLANLLERGEHIVVGVCGVFGERMCAVARRMGAQVTRVDAEWGAALSADEMARAIAHVRPQVVAFVHAETSTGVLQPVRQIVRAARDAGALTVLDCVTSLGGTRVALDEWGIDAAYAATQKCLSCPPGLAPVSFGARALRRIAARQTPVQSWYLDAALLGGYYGAGARGARVYHHTAPISAVYALAAALQLVEAEGMPQREARHKNAQQQLLARLAPLGFAPLVTAAVRLPQLSALRLPPQVHAAAGGEAGVRRRLLLEHGIEVGGGLGKLAGKVWRVGLMGENARGEAVQRLEAALRALLS